MWPFVPEKESALKKRFKAMREEPARRIPAGSGGCLTSRDPTSQEIKREHALSNKQVHATHIKRPDKLFLEVTNRHNKL
jgi:hypothetical protein